MIMGLALVVVPSAQAGLIETMNFASVGNATINITGTGTATTPTGDITLTPSSASGSVGYDFVIGSTTFGTATGGLCSLATTGFTFGAPYTTEAGGTATVYGTGALTIEDGAGHNLTADVTFPKFEVNSAGTTGNLNDLLSFNVTNLSYDGSDPDLYALSHLGSDAIDWMTFQIYPPALLSDLGTEGNTYTTSYSGTLVAPLPPDAVLFGTGLLGLLVLRRRKFFKA
jgi:hypothetical protein